MEQARGVQVAHPTDRSFVFLRLAILDQFALIKAPGVRCAEDLRKTEHAETGRAYGDGVAVLGGTVELGEHALEIVRIARCVVRTDLPVPHAFVVEENAGGGEKCPWDGRQPDVTV